MLWTVVAISGMLAARTARARRARRSRPSRSPSPRMRAKALPARKRFMRNGCYQIESGGRTGGAGYARDSQAGCHRPADVAAVFAKLDAIGADALVREGAAEGARRQGRAARRAGGCTGRLADDGSCWFDRDGSRWVAANQATAANQLLAAVNELPSENQWYATPPAKPVGAGAQLVVAVGGESGPRRLAAYRASLASDGRWWCYRSVLGPRGGEPQLPAKEGAAAATDAAARLGRILAG